MISLKRLVQLVRAYITEHNFIKNIDNIWFIYISPIKNTSRLIPFAKYNFRY